MKYTPDICIAAFSSFQAAFDYVISQLQTAKARFDIVPVNNVVAYKNKWAVYKGTP